MNFLNVLYGKYVPPFDVLRNQNIKFLFIRTICSMDEAIGTYDYCLARLCSRVKNPDDMREEINLRALDMAMKLIDYKPIKERLNGYVLN